MPHRHALHGTRLQMVLRDPTFTTADGALGVLAGAVEWRDAPDGFVAPDDRCEHIETVCRRCAETWAIDWMFRAVRPDGAVVAYAA